MGFQAGLQDELQGLRWTGAEGIKSKAASGEGIEQEPTKVIFLLKSSVQICPSCCSCFLPPIPAIPSLKSI